MADYGEIRRQLREVPLLDWRRRTSLILKLPADEQRVLSCVGESEPELFCAPHLIARLTSQFFKLAVEVTYSKPGVWPEIPRTERRRFASVDPPIADMYEVVSPSDVFGRWANDENQTVLASEANAYIQNPFSNSILLDSSHDAVWLQQQLPRAWFELPRGIPGGLQASDQMVRLSGIQKLLPTLGWVMTVHRFEPVVALLMASPSYAKVLGALTARCRAQAIGYATVEPAGDTVRWHSYGSIKGI